MKLYPFRMIRFISKSCNFFSSNPRSNLKPNPNLNITHPTLLLIESCNSMAQLRQIQGHMTRTGLIFHLFPVSRLLSFCALDPNGDIHHASLMFSQVWCPNVYIWNTMMRGYVSWSVPERAFCFFNRMIREGVEMDNKSYVFALKASGILSLIETGLSVQCRVWKVGFVDDLIVRNALLHFYMEKGQLSSAKYLFLESCVNDVVSWTSLINGFVRNNKADEALDLFGKMCFTIIEPNEVTMIALCSACSLKGDLAVAVKVHELAFQKCVNFGLNLMNAVLDMYLKCGDLDKAEEIFDTMEVKDVFSWTSMINGYAKRGKIELAKKCFDEMPQRNAISWTALIACYSQNSKPREALEIFEEMEMKGLVPVESTLVCVLSACSQMNCLDTGKRVHDHYIKQKRIHLSLIIANALIDMYAKCGCVDTASEIFLEMADKDLVSWNSIITCYASHGRAEEALMLFEQMKRSGFRPDSITLIGVLSACAHGGLVAQGWDHFKNMEEHHLKPTVEHYTCLIDLLSRVGLLTEAYELIGEMPVEPDAAVWGALLNGCKLHKNIELGKIAANKVIELDPKDSGIYLLLASLCADEREWHSVTSARSLMRENGVRKNPGRSSIEVDGTSHEFLVGDEKHPRTEAIYKVLNEIFWLSRLVEICSSDEEYLDGFCFQ